MFPVPGYDFDKAKLLEYDHMSFGGAPINAGTEEEAEDLLLRNERESAVGNAVEVSHFIFIFFVTLPDSCILLRFFMGNELVILLRFLGFYKIKYVQFIQWPTIDGYLYIYI